MKKRIIFSALLSFMLISITTSAQVEYDQSLEYPNFYHLSKTENFLFTNQPVKGEPLKSDLKLYDHSGNLVKQHLLEGKTSPIVTYYGNAGDNTVFALQLGGYFFVDKDGNEIGRKDFEGVDKVKSEKMLFCDDGFIVIQQVKIKKVGVGLRVRKFDPMGNELWMYEKFAEKGRYNFSDSAVKADGSLAFLYNRGAFSTDFGLCLLAPDGTELAFNELTKAPDSSVLGLSEGLNGEWLLKGNMYEKPAGGPPTANGPVEKPLGLYIRKFSGTDGSELEEVNIDFKSFQAEYGYLTSNGTAVYENNPPVIEVLDIINVSGVNYFLCEGVQISRRTETIPSQTAGVAPTTVNYNSFTLLDYYLLDYSNPTGQPIIIWKPERIVEFVKSSSFSTELSIRKDMHANKLYSYQGMVEGKILSRGLAQMFNYYTLIDIEEGGEDIRERTFWSLPLDDGNSRLPNCLTYRNIFQRVLTESQVVVQEGLVHVNDGFLVYAYDYRTNQLQLTKQNY